MANYTFRQEITQGTYAGSNVGIAYNTSTSITDVSPGANTAGQALTIQPNQLQVGTHLHVVAKGIVSNTATPNLTLGVYYGAVAGTALCTTGAIATVSGLSNNSFHLEADIWVVTTGVSGTASAYADGFVMGPYGSATLPSAAFMPATSSTGNLVSSGIDTTVSKLLTIGATWGANSASNSLQILRFSVEQTNQGAA